MQDRLTVNQRAGEPCPRCGRSIRRVVVGGRATHFCSWCQRLPAADRAGGRAATILRTMATPERRGRGGAGVAAGGGGGGAGPGGRPAGAAPPPRAPRAAGTPPAGGRGSRRGAARGGPCPSRLPRV